MHRIDTSTAQIDKFGHGKNGFTNGDPATGRRATGLNSDMWDAVQEEICAVIESSGMALNKEQHDQLYQAIIKIINSKLPDALLKKNNLSDVANRALALANIGGVPSTRKVNNKALSADVTLSADDVVAVPSVIRGVINGSMTMASANKTGWWQVAVPDTSKVSDFPKKPDGSRLYGYGYMLVWVTGNTWFQHYYAHHGEVAYRQDWSTGPSASVEWDIDYNTANKPGAGDVGAYTKGECDTKFQPKGNYTPTGTAYTKSESDARYNLKNTSNRAANGWFKDNSTGIIFQWGTSNRSNFTTTQSFPIAFPSKCLAVFGSLAAYVSDVSGSTNNIHTRLGSNTSFSWDANSTENKIMFFAIGY